MPMPPTSIPFLASGIWTTADRIEKTLFAPQQFAICRWSYDNSGIQYLATTGAGPCVILTLYSPDTRGGLVAHFDSDGIVSPPHECRAVLRGLLDKFYEYHDRNRPAELKIILGMGPVASSRELMSRLKSEAENHLININLDFTGWGSALLDLASGRVSTIRDEFVMEERQLRRMALLLQRSSAGLIGLYPLKTPVAPVKI